jgi:hypothetical protein
VTSLGHQLEMTKFALTQAMWGVAMQHERAHTTTQDDERFGGLGFRQEIDLQFLLIALRRLRRMAGRVNKLAPDDALRKELGSFDGGLPTLKTMRDVDEHLDEYIVGDGQRKEDIELASLGVSLRAEGVLEWAGLKLDLDDALVRAERLYKEAVRVMAGHAA